MADDTTAAVVKITDRNAVKLLRTLEIVESGVFIITVHKKSIVKVQSVARDNLMDEKLWHGS